MRDVRAGFGPTLPELLGPRRWRVVRAVAVAAAVALAAALLWPPGDESVVVGRGAVPFNFIHDDRLRVVGPGHVEQRRGRTFVQSMRVTELRLPAYRGDVGGTLPILADRLAQRLGKQVPGFRVVSEGRARINENPGYGIAWEGERDGRRLFGRDYLLVPDEPAPRAGVRLALRSTYAGGVSEATAVGSDGLLKRPLRSFRFGTERP